MTGSYLVTCAGDSKGQPGIGSIDYMQRQGSAADRSSGAKSEADHWIHILRL